MNASLPIQPLVVFSNPSLQTHLYEPSVLTQSAVAVSQGMSVSLHSLMSLLHNVPVQPDLQTHPCLWSHSFAPRPQLHGCEQLTPKYPSLHSMKTNMHLKTSKFMSVFWNLWWEDYKWNFRNLSVGWTLFELFWRLCTVFSLMCTFICQYFFVKFFNSKTLYILI